MNTKITKLELTNFKCFRHKEFSFDSDVTTIRGRNGVGKTTIADAILWCLFGKNSAGQATFSIKTHDAEGNDIPHLDHSVSITLRVSDDSPIGMELTLKRTLRETWVKKRGASEETLKGHTTEYFVNGDSFTAKDYEKYISNLVNEDIFRAITNPSYFPSLKWQQQREFLTKMVGYITPEEIATTDTLADFVKSSPESNDKDGVDIITIRKHLSYQIKQIKEKLDRIPVRLEEQNKALPEKLDWDVKEMTRDFNLKQIEGIDAKIVAIKSGNGGDVLRDEIRKEIQAIRTDMEKIEVEQRKSLRLRQDEHEQAITEARRQFNQLVSTQRDLETSIPSFDTFKKRCQETLDQCERDAQNIREEWSNNLSRTLKFSDSDCVCPTCGQYLPEEQVAEKRQKAETNLNADKARIKSELTQKAELVKATRAEAEKMIADYDQKKTEAEKSLADIKEQINKAFSEKQELEKIQLPTIDTILSANVQYVALSKQLQEQQAKLDSVGITQEDNTRLADLQAKKEEYKVIVAELNAQLATRQQYDKIIALINGINEEQKDLVTQLSKLEKQEDVAREYQDRMNTILEERVNQHFKIVRWRMFRTVNNGGDPFDEPFCECYVDGVAYHDGLNQAARLNAGLDIINTLCRHYNVSAPIVLDNAESTINIIPTIGQQIRLQVADTDLQTV